MLIFIHTWYVVFVMTVDFGSSLGTSVLLDFSHWVFQFFGISGDVSSGAISGSSLDPSWFFSSLSQSAAAIVGLIGAILVTLLVQRQMSNIEERGRILADYLHLRVDLYKGFQRTKEMASNIAGLINKIEPVFRSGQTSVLVSNVSLDLAKRLRLVLIEDGFGNRIIDQSKFNDLVELHTKIQCLIGEIRTFREQQTLERCDEICDALVYSIESSGVAALHVFHQRNRFVDLSADVRRYKSSRFPKVFYFMLVTLIYLGWVCVFIPLNNLYAGPDVRIKELYLLLFVIGLLGVLVSLVVAIVSMHMSRKIEIPKRLQL